MAANLPHTVTFDCWGTLIREVDHGHGRKLRISHIQSVVGVGSDEAEAALEDAWLRHKSLWEQTIASGTYEIATWALEYLGIENADNAKRLSDELAQTAAESDLTIPLDGAHQTLAALEELGVRRALICDTGFTPGYVVRGILEKHGLLELLEVVIFSDEIGVPKPDPRMFRAALEGLGVSSRGAVHVGDLRRTDVQGGRGAGMRTIRIASHFDDQSDLPEADSVAESHTHLRQLLGAP